MIVILVIRFVPKEWPGLEWKVFDSSDRLRPAIARRILRRRVPVLRRPFRAVDELCSCCSRRSSPASAGIAIMTTVAYYISWSKKQDKPLPPPSPKPAAALRRRRPEPGPPAGWSSPFNRHRPRSIDGTKLTGSTVRRRRPGLVSFPMTSRRRTPGGLLLGQGQSTCPPSHFHAVVWIDHSQASIFHLGLSPRLGRNHIAPAAGIRVTFIYKANAIGSGHAAPDKAFYGEVTNAPADAVRSSSSVRPALKTELASHIRADAHQMLLAFRIAACGSRRSSLLDAEIIAYAKRHFKLLLPRVQAPG